MSLDEAKELGNIARKLLLVAGGNPAEASGYYVIANGGADDVVGMIISDVQMGRWRELGGQGESVYSELSLHADDEQKAFGGHCYGLETIVLIRDAVSGGVRVSINMDTEPTAKATRPRRMFDGAAGTSFDLDACP